MIGGRLPILLHLPGVPGAYRDAAYSVRVTARRTAEQGPGIEVFRRTFRITTSEP